MKAVLMSIQPKWCELIASGKKTVEVRKTKPKLETPFKVYIYETQGRKYSFNVKADTIAKHDDDRFLDCARGNPPIKQDKNGTPYFSYGRMKVIGEFVCDWITGVKCDNAGQAAYNRKQNTCISDSEIMQYANHGKVYYWHISNLKIYDKPKELSEFRLYNVRAYYDEELKLPMPTHEIKRPPQSWCYVEEMAGER